jgi:hypothetical protein
MAFFVAKSNVFNERLCSGRFAFSTVLDFARDYQRIDNKGIETAAVENESATSSGKSPRKRDKKALSRVNVPNCSAASHDDDDSEEDEEPSLKRIRPSIATETTTTTTGSICDDDRIVDETTKIKNETSARSIEESDKAASMDKSQSDYHPPEEPSHQPHLRKDSKLNLKVCSIN